MIDPEQKRKGIEKAVKYGLLAVALAVTGPIAYYATLGLWSWIALGGSLFVVHSFAPVVATWVANKRIQALVAVIEANPIETMQNLYMDKSADLQRAENNIMAFETEYRNVDNLVNDLKKTDPEEAQAYAEMRDTMKAGLDGIKAEQAEAAQELKSFASQIDKAKRIWKVSCAMNKALEKSQSAQAQEFARIKEQVSFDKVRTNLNQAFSRLNRSVERRKVAGALPPKVEVVDVTKPNKTVKVIG